jgi:molybdopterin/thiamine biosynthesis adenylyltransferase
VDFDTVERTNLTRQLFYPADLTRPKASALARNLAAHTLEPAELTAYNLSLEEAVDEFTLPADILIVGVDRNNCRRFACELARRRRIPAIFTMLSADGMRVHCFLQGPNLQDACLWCALPNLDPNHAMACTPAQIATCLLAAGMTTFFVLRAVMGWPEGVEPYNWREADLLGQAPDRIGRITQHRDCPVCSSLTS